MPGLRSGTHLRAWGAISIICRVAFATTAWALLEIELAKQSTSALTMHGTHLRAIMWTWTALVAAQVCFYPATRYLVHKGWDTANWLAPLQDTMNFWSVLLFCFIITLFVQADWYFSNVWRFLNTANLALITVYIVNNLTILYMMFTCDFAMPPHDRETFGTTTGTTTTGTTSKARERDLEEGKRPAAGEATY